MVTMSATAQALLADLPDAEVIPLPFVRDRIGWTRDQQSYAVESGVIHPVDKRGKAGCYQVTREDAVLILVAAALALAAGVAVVMMIRAIKDAGLNPSALAQAAVT
jgi:hypothetical protein